ncbi:translocation/assembly module TamB domain-containing protein [Halomonas elongata]|uniref:autotransporter assembly complex protein TamB n=1 Tax=Halomonas elongata TaxID=2746 RepID=UPI002E2C7113|nr:translocation/assembly module TamB domain-containing protein [Halomonas elongata]WVI73173.1 translocation/assembly module TamB domain-containing protein [Halomonas elongata]
MRVRRLTWALARLVILIPLWLIGLLSLLLGLALSPWGTGLLLEQGKRMGFYEFSRAEGAPLDTFILEDLSLDAGPASVAIQRLELAWADDCLLDGRLCLDRFVVEGARVRLASSEEPSPAADEASEGGGLPDPIELPFPIELRELALNDVEVRLADGTQLRWDEFETGATAESDTLRLLPTRLEGARLTLPLSAGNQLALSESEHDGPILTAAAIDASIATHSPLPASAAPEAAGMASQSLEDKPRIELPEIHLPLAVEVPELTITDAAVEGAFAYQLEELALSVTARDQEISIEPLSVASPEADASLKARMTLSGNYPLEAQLNADLYLPERMPALEGERIELGLNGDLADLQVDLTTTGPVETRLSARLDALAPTLPFTASFQSPALQWPLPGAENASETATPEEGQDAGEGDGEPPAPWRAEDLSLEAEGKLTDYRVQLSLAAQGPQLPRTQLDLSGRGDLAHFIWEPLALEMDEASVTTQGRVDWADGLAVAANLALQNVNPEPFVEGLAGQLDGDAEVSFTQDADGWRVEVPSLSVNGTLADYPLRLDAQLAGDSRMNWDIRTLEFRQGDNQLSASGQVSPEQLDVSADLDMPALKSLYPALAGALSGSINASGSLEAPQLDLDLNGNGLAFAENRVNSLNLTGEVAGLEDPSLDLALNAKGVEAGGQAFDDIDLNLDGRLSEHRLTLDVSGPADGLLSSLSLAMDGAMDRERQHYSGRLTPLEAETEYGRLALDDALVFDADLASSAVDVQPFCLRREEGGGLCLEEALSASPDAGRAVLAIRELPMDLINDAMPPGWRIDGSTEGGLVAEWSRGGAAWKADAQLASEVEIAGQDAYGNPWTVPGTGLNLDLQANQARADVNLALTLGDSGAVRLDLGVDDPMGVGRLDGSLRVDDLRLSPYRPLVTDVKKLEGGFGGNVEISGTREQPRLDGTLELAGLQAAGLGLPLTVQDGRLTVNLQGDRADLDGFLASERGRLEIDGDASWPSTSDWQVALNLQGQDEPLQASLSGFGRLRLAPDLNIRATPDRLRVRGEVRIPWARLEVGQVPASAQSVSPDEVIVTREEAEAQEAAQAAGESTAEAMAEAGMAMDVRVTLALGPDMRLSAYGLETGLAGNLEVRQDGGPVQIFGDVNLEDGRFRAFAQDLVIREGILYFSGPPGEPLLDFEAIRNPDSTEDDVIAGIQVSGPASSPSLKIFSEPAMDESRALSYVLRGRAPDASGGADGALTSALIGLSLGQAGGTVGALGEAFGIQDLRLDSAGSGEDSQVVVTGNLTDRLSVGYGVGVFSPIAELTLRYKLWRNLYLEAVSGASQAVDLIYTFSLPGDPPSLE